MTAMSSQDWQAAEKIAAIGFTNPFLPERITLERDALGDAFLPFVRVLQYRPGASVADMFPNFELLTTRAEQLVTTLAEQLRRDGPTNADAVRIYEDLVLFVLYCRFLPALDELIDRSLAGSPSSDVADFYTDFRRDFDALRRIKKRTLLKDLEPATIFAGLFQFQRAFRHIFRAIVGGATQAARLRAAIWESIFTHDMRRYVRVLHRFMGEVTTLVIGPSGTGKELVARAIAGSRFIEFDTREKRFVRRFDECFHGLNLSALTPTLIESELFGHVKGAFNEAQDRDGFLDESVCSQWDSVFLDEIGELDPVIQVKLLRVLQTREFHKVGDSRSPKRFRGKIIAATNRDLEADMQSGDFRPDFYYRLCADQIATVSLRDQLRDAPEEMVNFTRFIARRLLPDADAEAERLAGEVEHWISRHVPADYAWPGNFRELEQCVRSVMIHGKYIPSGSHPAPHAAGRPLVDGFTSGAFTRDELLTRYYSLVYAQSGSYQAAGKRLGIDWRTVRATIDPTLVEALRGAGDVGPVGQQ